MKYFVASRSILTRLFILAISLLITLNCAKRADEIAIQKILAEIGELQTKEEVFAREVASRAGSFTADHLASFPDNRTELAAIAEQQITSLNNRGKLLEEQIAKLESANSVTSDKNYLTYIELTKQDFEKSLSWNQLSVQQYALFTDPSIDNRKLLDEKINEITAKQKQIDQEQAELESKRVEFRKRIGK